MKGQRQPFFQIRRESYSSWPSLTSGGAKKKRCGKGEWKDPPPPPAVNRLPSPGTFQGLEPIGGVAQAHRPIGFFFFSQRTSTLGKSANPRAVCEGRASAASSLPKHELPPNQNHQNVASAILPVPFWPILWPAASNLVPTY